jgi:cobalt/nickel transport system permease protein
VHIPDGFISPQTFLPAYLLTLGLWWIALNRVKSVLSADHLPLIAVSSALAFVLMMIALPLPGGTSVHALGVAMLTVVFGFWVSFLAISMVLLMQALLFGDGGITALPINVLGIAFLGSLTAHWVVVLLKNRSEILAFFLAGSVSVLVSSLFVAVMLGIQPLIAMDEQGHPLFFPFGLSVTLPAVLIPHLMLSIAEGVLTVMGGRFLLQYQQRWANDS